MNTVALIVILMLITVVGLGLVATLALRRWGIHRYTYDDQWRHMR
jgi:uncharacterized membrane protein